MKITKGELASIFDSFNKLSVLVIGDVMIDSYIYGTVSRISPEAPVPVLEVTRKEDRPGGAANVAQNLHALGAKAILCSVIGKDAPGDALLSLLKKEKLSTEGILQSKKRISTVKTRVIGNKHQMLRVDNEITTSITKEEEDKLFESIKKIIKTGKIQAVIFEDYDKGVITETLINRVTQEAHKHTIPIAVDPKKRNFLAYKHADLFKPNLRELKDGLKVEFNHQKQDEMDKHVKKLSGILKQKYTLVTLSELGVYVSDNKKSKIIPAHVRNIADVSGAGDTVISVATLCLALKKDMEFIAALSNLAGGLVCEKVGVVSIDKKLLYEESLSLLK